MARNKRPVQDKPVAESSEEEEQNNSDQQTDSDSANLNTDGISKPTSSSSESETDSDSDRPSNFTIKPIDSKQQPPNKAASKRPAESEAELGLGELKKIKVENDNVKKPSIAHRIFSEDDEIALLEGMVAFQSKKGIDAYSDIPKFHDFIKKSIHFDATPNQLKEKIRRLRSKYISNVKKCVVLSKSHDLKVFNLSKKLWGSTSVKDEPAENAKKNKESDANDGRGITLALASKGEDAKKQKKVANGGGTKVKESGSDAEEHQMVDEKGDGEEDYSLKYPLCVGGLMEAEGLSHKSREFWVQNLGLIGKANLVQYEAKLEKIKWAELELFIQKKELINEKLRLLLQSSKTSR